MTDKPIPTAEAVDRLAGAQYAWVSAAGGGMKTPTGEPVEWAEVPERLKVHQREMSLDLLLAVWPQIVADVLNAVALEWEDACADDPSAPCRCSAVTNLRDRAAEVQR